jgi:hypothetical protein
MTTGTSKIKSKKTSTHSINDSEDARLPTP